MIRASIVTAILGLALPTWATARDSPYPVGWDVIEAAGLRVDYPRSIFSDDAGPAKKGLGRIFRTSDGRAGFTYYVADNREHLDPRSFIKAHVRSEGLRVDYLRRAKDFVVVSGVRQGKIYYSRCNFPRGPIGSLHCIELVYDQSEKTAWDAIVTRISLSLR